MRYASFCQHPKDDQLTDSVAMGILGCHNIPGHLLCHPPGLLLSPQTPSRYPLGRGTPQSRLCRHGQLHWRCCDDPLRNRIRPARSFRLAPSNRFTRRRICMLGLLRRLGDVRKAKGSACPNKTLHREQRAKTYGALHLRLRRHHVLLRE